jgi:hypothetical protein
MIRKIAHGIALGICLVPVTSWSVEADFSKLFFGAGIEQFTWEELDEDGRQLLIEKGQRFVLSVLYQTESAKGDSITEFGGDVYFGTVEYDGETQDGVQLFSDTGYLGARLQISNESYFLTGERHSLGIMGGVGMDTWQRDLNDSIDVLGRNIMGYEETYFMIYLKLGLAWRYQSGDWQQRLKLGLRRPILVEEQIDDFNASLSPEPTTTLFVAWDHSWKLSRQNSLGMMLYYDRTHFEPSDIADSAIGPVYQPESDTTSTGIKLLYTFK